MSKCAHCHERKGKRPCPALDGMICSQCCGEYRLVRISCPADCVYLDSSSDYQQKRIGERFLPSRRDFYKELYELGGEKAASFFNLLEVVAFSYFLTRRDGQDAEIISGIQDLRRTVSPLHIPGGPQAAFAEHLKKEYDAYAKQDVNPQLEHQMKTDVLDKALLFIKDFSGPGLQSQRFLNGLIGYIKTYHPSIAEHLAKKQESGHIILPGQFAPPSQEASGQLQTHEHTHTHTHDHTCDHKP